jgi:hypothetical protein
MVYVRHGMVVEEINLAAKHLHRPRAFQALLSVPLKYLAALCPV